MHQLVHYLDQLLKHVIQFVIPDLVHKHVIQFLNIFF